MTEGWEVEYKAKLRAFMEVNAYPIQFNKRWDSDPEDEVSVYGWTDWDAVWHIRDDDCSWIIPEGAELYERTYSQFQDTFTDNENEVGVNVLGCHCACGQYKDIGLRYAGSLSNVLNGLLTMKGRSVQL